MCLLFILPLSYHFPCDINPIIFQVIGNVKVLDISIYCISTYNSYVPNIIFLVPYMIIINSNNFPSSLKKVFS